MTLPLPGPVDDPKVQAALDKIAQEFPVSGTAGPAGPTGPKGDKGATGSSGVIAVTSPITNSGTSTSASLGFDSTGYVKTSDTGTVTSTMIANGTITDTNVASANKDGTAATASLRTLGTSSTQAAAGNDSRLSDSRTPSGSAGGDLTGSYPNPTLGTTGTAGTYTKVTTDAKGRVSSGTTLSASDVPTLTASKISDFDTQVRTSRLDQMATPTADVSFGSKKLTSLATPTANNDATNKAYVDGAISTGGSLNYSTYFGTPMFMAGAPASTASGATNNQRTAYVLIMSTVTLTGIVYRVGSTASGNVKAGLYDASLTKVAETTATVAQATANTTQQVAFASTYTATPGYYWLSLTFSSSTATFVGAVSIGPGFSLTNASFAATTPTGFANLSSTVPSMLTY